MNFFSKIFLTAWLGVQSFLGINHTEQVEQPSTVFGGTFNPTGGQTYRLQSSISSTQTSITLSSFKEPVSNIPYTMSYLNSDIQYGTIDPQNNNSKEFISFSGITQNSDGTATLTGVVRGLGFSYPYTASTTLQQPHSGQSIFILSNPPQLYNKYANKSNDQSILAIWDFSTYLPTTSIAATSSNQFANKAYVDSVAVAGAPVATEAVTGIGRLATQLQMASSTFSAGAPTVLYSKYSTSSPYTTGLYIPITRNDGKLSPLFIGTTTSDIYKFGGKLDFNGNASTTGISAGYGYFGGTATTSISNTGVVTLATTTAGLLKTNSSGVVYAGNPARYNLLDGTNITVTSGSFATSTSELFIPANTLSASSTINIVISFTGCNGTGGTCTTYLRTSTGAQIFSFTRTDDANTMDSGFAQVVVASNNSSTFSAQTSIGTGYYTVESTPASGNIITIEATSAIDFTQNVTLKVVGRGVAADYTIENFSIVVNP